MNATLLVRADAYNLYALENNGEVELQARFTKGGRERFHLDQDEVGALRTYLNALQ